jgi:hypothetical protein
MTSVLATTRFTVLRVLVGCPQRVADFSISDDRIAGWKGKARVCGK